MNQKPLCYVANWKMNMPFSQAMAFCNDHKERLSALGAQTEIEIVLCPSFVALQPLIHTAFDMPLAVGAQNCSDHQSGAYTGEIDALSLAQIGCRYCIVGHSERRIHFAETAHMVAQKVEHLATNRIQPIICIGETQQEYESQQTTSALQNQLEPVIESLKRKVDQPFCIAYEPVWSIGTGIVADVPYLKKTFQWINSQIGTALPEHQFRLLYGGSVNEQSIAPIKQIEYIDGFLIGGASLEFKKFEKIVSLG